MQAGGCDVVTWGVGVWRQPRRGFGDIISSDIHLNAQNTPRNTTFLGTPYSSMWLKRSDSEIQVKISPARLKPTTKPV